jgi:hypothetical protein
MYGIGDSAMAFEGIRLEDKGLGGEITNTGDLLACTLPKLARTFSETLRNTDTPATKVFFGGSRAKSSSGTSYVKKVRAQVLPNFRFVNMFETRSRPINDVMVQLQMLWRHWDTHWGMDDREVAMNSDAEQIIDIIKGRRSGCYEDAYNVIEAELCGQPKSKISSGKPDTDSLWGLLYYFPTLKVGEGTVGTAGFDGDEVTYGDGDTDSVIAGADRTNIRNERLRTMVGCYDEIDENFINVLRYCMTRTAFMTMPELEGDDPAPKTPVTMFAAHSTVDDMIARVNQGPDDKEGDLERFSTVRFQGIPFIRTPEFDAKAFLPVVGVKLSKTYGRILKGRWFKELKPMNSREAPETWVVPTVGSCNLCCDDPRSGGFTLHKIRTA